MKRGSKNKAETSSAPVRIVDKNINIKKISNGFVVSTYTEKGEKAKFCKNRKEVKNMVGKMV